MNRTIKDTIKAAQELMENRRITRWCNMFSYVVEISHHDGSHLIFQNATSKIRWIHGQRMLLVWTERKRQSMNGMRQDNMQPYMILDQ